ncbi:MAG: 60S ribosomal protein L31 [archaeon]|nr:60S ribosomal protein L31 [archaeon]
MGKKVQAKKEKKEAKELGAVTRGLTVHLHKLVHEVKFKKKAPRAIRLIKDLAAKTMFTKDVRIDPDLNKEIWRNGIRNLPVRINLTFERKKNEEDDENEEKMYTLVKLAPMAEL